MTNRLFIHSHTVVFTIGVVPADPAASDMDCVSGQGRAEGAGARAYDKVDGAESIAYALPR